MIRHRIFGTWVLELTPAGQHDHPGMAGLDSVRLMLESGDLGFGPYFMENAGFFYDPARNPHAILNARERLAEEMADLNGGTPADHLRFMQAMEPLRRVARTEPDPVRGGE